jgi:quercetin dioxygenase-like cupin family protein
MGEGALSGYRVLTDAAFAAPSWNPQETAREVIEVREGLVHSQAALWRFPPGGANRRHVEPVQEEVFCVIEGTLAAYLGDPPERFELQPRSIVVVEPGTALQLRNESDTEVVLFAYGAPAQGSDYVAEKLPDAY